MTEIAIFRRDIGAMQTQFQRALPAHVDPDRFQRAVESAVGNNPKLLQCDRHSLMAECMKAAQDGLVIDGREAAMVPFRSKGGSLKAVYIPMYGGILKKIRNSGQLSSIAAHVVYANDKFAYELGDDERILHRPSLNARGKPVAVYGIARLKDGGVHREVMSTADIEAIRSRSRAKDDGPWVTDWDQMARKTVLRRMANYLPSSTDLEILRRDDELYGMKDVTPPRPQPQDFAAKEIPGQDEHVTEDTVQTDQDVLPGGEGSPESDELRSEPLATANGEDVDPGAPQRAGGASDETFVLWDEVGEEVEHVAAGDYLERYEAIGHGAANAGRTAYEGFRENNEPMVIVLNGRGLLDKKKVKIIDDMMVKSIRAAEDRQAEELKE